MVQKVIPSLRVRMMPHDADLTQDSDLLDLRWRGLTDLPDTLRGSTHLRRLYLDGNQLTSLSSWIGEIESLEELHADDNHLIALPDSVGNLRNLTRLSTHRNKITALPHSL